LKKRSEEDHARVEHLETELKALEDEKVRLEDFLGVKIGELNETNQTLANTREVVQNQENQIQVHKKTEVELYGHVQVFQKGVSDTLRDVEGLHNKIDRKLSVDEENKRSLNSMKRYFNTHADTIDRTVGSYRTTQSDSFSKVNDWADRTRQEKSAEISKVGEQLGAFEKVLESDRSRMSDLVVEHNKSSMGNFNGISSLQVAAADRLTALVDGNLRDFSAASSVSTDKVQEHRFT